MVIIYKVLGKASKMQITHLILAVRPVPSKSNNLRVFHK
jgi:hypothetical protein